MRGSGLTSPVPAHTMYIKTKGSWWSKNPHSLSAPASWEKCHLKVIEGCKMQHGFPVPTLMSLCFSQPFNTTSKQNLWLLMDIQWCSLFVKPESFQTFFSTVAVAFNTQEKQALNMTVWSSVIWKVTDTLVIVNGLRFEWFFHSS